MKIRRILPILLGVVMLGGCAHKNESGKKAIESYSQALSDSIRNVTAEIDSCNDVSTTLTDKINNLLPEFRAVEKSREVEGYMIFQGWENKYPLTSTGVVARLSASRQLELVAVLKGGNFDQIRVNGPQSSASSSVVPNDQALNYRQDGMNTVMFTGKEADEVANLIADNELNPVTITFLNNGKTVGSYKLPHDNAKMITMTYLLYSTQKEQMGVAQKSILLGEKLKLLREHQENK